MVSSRATRRQGFAPASTPRTAAGSPLTPYLNTRLVQGSHGAAVSVLQRRLGGVVADGQFGPLTRAKVLAYQRAAHLLANGAAAALDRAIARLGLAAPGAAPLVTLAEHARQVCARRVAEGHRNARNELLSVELHIAGDPIGRMPLGLVDRTHARAWLGRMVCKVSTKTRRPLATQTIRNALNLARVLVAAAVDVGELAQNPFADLIVPRAVARARPPKATTFLLAGEIDRLLAAAAAVPELARAVAFAIGTCVRLEEMLLLDAADVVTEGERPHVVVRWGSRDKITGERLPPKGLGRTRTVPLFGMALDAARAQLATSPGVVDPREGDRPGDPNPGEERSGDDAGEHADNVRPHLLSARQLPRALPGNGGAPTPARPLEKHGQSEAVSKKTPTKSGVVTRSCKTPQKPRETGECYARERAAASRGVEARPSALRCEEGGALFFPGSRKGTPPGGRKAWEDAIASVELGRAFRWHDLRGTGATHLLAGTWGAPWPIATVSKMLGHASIAVTQRYARVLDDSLFAAGAQLRSCAIIHRDARETRPDAPQPSNVQGEQDETGDADDADDDGSSGEEPPGLRNRCSTTELNRPSLSEEGQADEVQAATSDVKRCAPPPTEGASDGRAYEEWIGRRFDD